MSNRSRFCRVVLCVLSLCLAACTNETVVTMTVVDTVFVDRGIANPPPDSAAGLHGYFTPSSKMTTCGNCHVDAQGPWSGTKHAGAFLTLDSLGEGRNHLFPEKPQGLHGVPQRHGPEPVVGAKDIIADQIALLP